MKGRLSFTAAVLLCASSTVWAQPTKLGAQFKVNACTNCTHTLPAVAGTPSGRFLAVWEGSHATDPRGIVERFFEPNGNPRGGDVLASRPPAPEQYDPSAAADRQGNYVVVWSSYATERDGDIVAQRFRANGQALGAPIPVNVDNPATPVPADDFSPAVAKAADGGFVVVWLSLLPPSLSAPGTPPDVYARRFNAAGAPLGPQVKLSNSLVSGDRPDVCIDGLGRSIVSWTSVDKFEPFEPSLRGVTVRRLNPAGALLGAPIIVAPPRAEAAPSAVTCGAGNVFVVAWQSNLAPGGESDDILGRRYTPAGRPAAGGVFRINSGIAGNQRIPAISASPTGHFVAVWTSKVDDEVQVLGRRFGPNGAPLGPDFVIDPSLGDRSRPAEPEVAHLGTAGNFVVVWREGVAGLLGQRYRP